MGSIPMSLVMPFSKCVSQLGLRVCPLCQGPKGATITEIRKGLKIGADEITCP